MRPVTTLLCTLLAACTPGGDGTNTDIPIPSGSADDCGTSSPVIEEATIRDGGPQQFDQGTFPSIIISADTSDEDGDLHYYEMRVWWDDEIDGSVDTSEAYQEVYGTVSNTECATFRTTFSMQLGINGSEDLPYATELEFGVVVYDDLENATNGGDPTIVVFTTPAGLE